MNNFKDFTNKLTNVQWSEAKRDMIKGNFTDSFGNTCSITLSLSVEISNKIKDIDLPFQAVFSVKINNYHVQSWGSISEGDNIEMLTYFNNIKNIVDKECYKRRRSLESYSEELYKKL